MSEKLLLIDANSLIYRAYHALPPLNGPNGVPTGALYGLASVLIRLLKEGAPRYAAAAFDRPEPTFRKEKFDAYKATRPPTPDDLIPQLKEAKVLLNHFGIKTLDAPGFEADDIIATLAERFKGKTDQVVILSGDLDLLQLVDGEAIVAEMPQKGISETATYNTFKVIERFGVGPDKIPDYKGLVGDKSDNIPGVSGIGPKTATVLIQKYGSVEGIYENLEQIKKESSTLGNKLEENKEVALLSKELATVSRQAPSPEEILSLETTTSLDSEELHEYLKSFGFQTLVKRIEKVADDKDDRIGKLF